MAETLTFEELMAGFAEIREMMRETDAQIRETREMMRETDAKIAELVAEGKKTDAKIAELAAESKKTDVQVGKVSKQLGGIGNNAGEVTEECFAEALAETMTFAGMNFDTIDTNIKMRKGKLQDEFDIVMYNGNSIALIEAKYKAHEKDLQRLVTSKVQNFRTLLPDYASYKIYLGLASMAFYDELVEHAKELGVGILKQHGDIVEFSTETIRAY